MTKQPAVNTPSNAIAAAAALVEIERLALALHELVDGPDSTERAFFWAVRSWSLVDTRA